MLSSGCRMQKEHKKGGDVAEASRAGADTTPGTRPLRKKVNHTVENSSTEQDNEILRLTQDGHDSDYAEEALRARNANKEQHEDNKVKACAAVCSFCNKIMKSQIEEIRFPSTY